MLTLILLSAALSAPLLDVDLHGLVGPGGGVSYGPTLDLATRGGLQLTPWVTPRVGLDLRVDYGSYGAVSGDATNAFAFAGVRTGLTDDWGGALQVGTAVAWVEYAAGTDNPLWETHPPLFAAMATRELGLGALHVPVSVRAEASSVRWALALEAGLGLRASRR